MMETWQAAGIVVGVIAAVGGVLKLWVFPAVRTMSKVAELHPTWVKIGEDYKVNGGPTLHEQIDTIVENLDGVCDRLATVENKIDTFVLQRQKGGRRNGDPQ